MLPSVMVQDMISYFSYVFQSGVGVTLNQCAAIYGSWTWSLGVSVIILSSVMVRVMDP